MSVPLIWDMPVIWMYIRLACGVLAELSLPLLLTDAAVDTFPQHVGVAAVAGVLLNHVDQYRAPDLSCGTCRAPMALDEDSNEWASAAPWWWQQQELARLAATQVLSRALRGRPRASSQATLRRTRGPRLRVL